MEKYEWKDIISMYQELKTKTTPGGRPYSLSPTKNVNFSTLGRWIQDQDGNPFVLRGVSKSFLEYYNPDLNAITGMLVDFDLQWMRTWKINALRLPLRDVEWIQNPVYRDKVFLFIHHALREGMVVLLDLHTQGTHPGMDPFMIRGDGIHDALGFWKNVSQTFASVPAIFFELFNEPHDIPLTTWWQGDAAYYGYREILEEVRKHATNLCFLGGLDYAYQWAFLRDEETLQQEIRRFQNIVLTTHPYAYRGTPTLDSIHTEPIPTTVYYPSLMEVTTGDCHQGITLPTVESSQYGWQESFGYLHTENRFPVVATEFGLDRPDTSVMGGWYMNSLLDYMTEQEMGYVAWAWIQDRLDYPSLLDPDFQPTGRASRPNEGPPCGLMANHFYPGPGRVVYNNNNLQSSMYGLRLSQNANVAIHHGRPLWILLLGILFLCGYSSRTRPSSSTTRSTTFSASTPTAVVGGTGTGTVSIIGAGGTTPALS